MSASIACGRCSIRSLITMRWPSAPSVRIGGGGRPAEQEEFVKLFRDFLERIYSDKIDLYGGEKVLFGREVMDGDFAQVDSTLIRPKGEEIAVIYKLRRANGKWKVYDAVVENISIVNNYRSQFDRVISSSSYEELVKRLQEKAG